MASPWAQTAAGAPRPLAQALVSLAETPDDMPDIGDRLDGLAHLAADRIDAVDYAAIAARPDDGCCAVATDSRLVEAVEDAVTDVGGDAPPPTGRLTTTITWPRFRETAAGMGMSIVSVPVFTGGGAAVATLDLYGRDPAAMAPMTAGLCVAYDPELSWPDRESLGPLDEGGEELVEGFAEALAVRATIQLALDMITIGARVDGAGAYLSLRLHAADNHVSLLQAASTLITRNLGPR
ncbi:hypothetical protein [Actinoplanes xinjiangensis]|uniref:hypothetical protein n=1 Tax=Actinoplanes xinjiangensis TaxID=512350 RepID=UPI00342D9F75